MPCFTPTWSQSDLQRFKNRSRHLNRASACGRSREQSTWEVRTKSRLFSLSVVRWIITNQKFPVWSEQQQKKVYLHKCKCATENSKGLNQQQCRPWLHHAFDEARVQMNYEHSQEGHLLASVLKDDPWIIGLASKAVGGHHHSQIVHIHLGYSHIGWLGKYLQVMEKDWFSWGKVLLPKLNKKVKINKNDKNKKVLSGNVSISSALLNTRWCLPVESWWSNKAPACWVQAETELQWWPPLDRHSYWRTACRSSLGWEVPPAHDTTASLEMLGKKTKTTTSVHKEHREHWLTNNWAQELNEQRGNLRLWNQVRATNLGHWRLTDSLVSSTDLLGASVRSLHQCPRVLWNQSTNPRSHLRPQGGALLPPLLTAADPRLTHTHTQWDLNVALCFSWLFAVPRLNKTKTE